MSEKTREDQYLGDGIYLSDDGHQIWLAVGDHTNKVLALDRETFHNLTIAGIVRFKDIGSNG